VNKLTQAALACGVLMAASAASAAVPDDYLFLDAFAVSHDERIPDAEIGIGGRIGIGGIFSRTASTATGFELGIFTNPIKSSDRSGDGQTGILVDLMQFYSLGAWNPYIFAGLGGTNETVGPAKGIFFAIEAGGGLLFSLTDKLTARASLAAMSVHQDELRSGTDTYTDLRFNVGLMYPFGAGSAPAAPVVTRARDSDGDGLADDKDACPSTPAATADGCPAAPPVVQTDSDGDGVYDAQDECSGTLAGLKVDDKGCAVETVGGEAQSVVLKGVTFLPGSATLTAEAKVVLATAAAALSGQKSLEVELGGHTDSQGKDAANQALSQRRAESVRQYLIGQGIEAGRMTAVGYGETQPIADNATPAGRAENRRVEFKIK